MSDITASQSLYERSGDVKDVNTLLVNRGELRDAIALYFEAGWRAAASWASRFDLLADIGSPAYLRDRAEFLSAIAPLPSEGERLMDDSLGGR